MPPARHIVIGISIVAAASCRSTTQIPTGAQPTPVVSEVQRDNDEMVRRVLATIVGRENEPAGQVFTNVKNMTTVSARTFLSIMNGGYARALGVRCVHCHVEGNYASEDKRPKRAAREMAAMHRMINQELAKMDNLQTPKTDNRAINCSTCHRGMINPMQPSR